MRPHRWMLLTVVLVACSAAPVTGQDLTLLQKDLTLLQKATDHVAEFLERAHGVPLTAPRYIDASAVRRVLDNAGMPVPSVAELREALERDEPDKPRIIVVDAYEDASERGPPDDPRLQSFAVRAASPPAVRAGGPRGAGAPEEVSWVRNDGIIISPFTLQNPASLAGRFHYHVSFTQYRSESRVPYVANFRLSGR